MVLARSSAARHDAVRRFYSAFFTWSRHLASQSHRRPDASPRIPCLNSQAYSTAHLASVSSPRTQRLTRRTVFLTHQDCLAVTENENAVLKQLSFDMGVRFQFESAVPGHRHRRLWLSGDTSAVEKATRRLLALGGQSSIEETSHGSIPPPTSNEHTRNAPLQRPTSAASTPKKPVHTGQPSVRSFALSKTEIAHLDALATDRLDKIKADTSVETIAVETAPNGLPVLKITGTKDATGVALLQCKALLTSALSAATSKNFRTAMRTVPSPVAVVTTAWPDTSKRDWPVNRESDRIVRPGYRGMTVSSMTAVSLSPTSVVSFNIRKPSRTLDALQASGFFNIHIPAANTLGKAIADAFTKPHQDPSETFHHLHAQTGISVAEGRQRLPKISGDGVQLRYHCRLLPEKSVDIGDHVVLFAEVEKVSPNPRYLVEDQAGASQSNSSTNSGLVYVHGKYARVEEIAEQSPEVVAVEDESASTSQGSKPSVTVSSDNHHGSGHKLATTSTAHSATTAVPSANVSFSAHKLVSGTPLIHGGNSRLYSTCTTLSSNDKVDDPSVLSQTVAEYVFQPFDPKNRHRLKRMRTRIRQKELLEGIMHDLEEALENGTLDAMSFEAKYVHVSRMRDDAVFNELDEDEMNEFLQSLGQDAAASSSSTASTSTST